MAVASALLLGLVQGLTEFLPVSSSGHLVLAAELLDYESPGVVLEAVVHLATSLAIVVYFRQRFVQLLRASTVGSIRGDPQARRFLLMLALAMAGTVLLALLLRTWALAAFESPAVVGGMLLVTATALLSIWRVRPNPNHQSGHLYDMLLAPRAWRVALLVGLAQGLAVFPGLSRSGLTIVAGLWGGLGPRAAAEFSFLLAVPTILGAALVSLMQEPALSSASAVALLIAGVFSFGSGLLAIHWLMRWVQSGRLGWFAVYCGLVGSGALVLWGLGIM